MSVASWMFWCSWEEMLSSPQDLLVQCVKDLLVILTCLSLDIVDHKDAMTSSCQQ